MNILGIETSTEACSVALINHQDLIFSKFSLTPRKHTEFLPPMMDAVLSKAGLSKNELTHIAYASGPGAFTGVRIAASTAQGLSIGLNLPLIAISTLAVIAQQTADIHQVDKITATLDARMGEAYVASYCVNTLTQLVELKGDEKLLNLDKLENVEGYFSAGSGFKAKRESGLVNREESIDEEILPHAAALVKLAKQAVVLESNRESTPVLINYIRNNVAVKKKPVSL